VWETLEGGRQAAQAHEPLRSSHQGIESFSWEIVSSTIKECHNTQNLIFDQNNMEVGERPA
jgi:hypothetical protein